MTEFLPERVRGTTIDEKSLLSTDYFNHFNEVIMLLGILPEMPEMMEEVEAWNFKSYEQHFRESGLAVGPLAIEAYAYSPPPVRQSFDETIDMMRMIVETSREDLRSLVETGANDELAETAMMCSIQLQQLVERGSAIIHGTGGSLDQDSVDSFF